MPKANPTNARARIACALSALTVDAAARTISGGLQLMASGREAKGWGFWIDAKSVALAAGLIKAKGGRLKAYVTHDHSGPATFHWQSDGSELDVCGFFSSVADVNGQLVAERIEFYDTFAKDDAERFGRSMEMATKTPELLGLSLEFWFYRAYVGEDGNEYQERPDNVALKYGGMPAMRPVDVFAAAFVSDGAATDGLFARLSRKGGSAMKRLIALLGVADEEEPTAPDAPPAAPSPEGSPENNGDKNTQHPGANSDSAPSATTSATMKIIQDIKGRFGANEGRLSAAMTILGKATDPASLTIEGVALQVVEGELSSVQATLAAEKQRADSAEKSKGELSAENDKLKADIAALKGSGHAGGVDLGAGSAGGGAPRAEVNPWAKATFNVAQQVAITKANPTKAAALKASAG